VLVCVYASWKKFCCEFWQVGKSFVVNLGKLEKVSPGGS
jgi:DNA-binding LytR/AlgR family response regulator